MNPRFPLIGIPAVAALSHAPLCAQRPMAATAPFGRRGWLPGLLGVLIPAVAMAAPAPQTLLEITGAPAHVTRWSESVLVVIDAQREYTSAGRLALPDVTPALAQIQRLLAHARQAHVPIIHIQQVSPVGRGVFETGSPTTDFAAEATPLPGETIITKRLPNAFAGTTLADVLHRFGRHELILAGFMTHMCISATARSALDHGYHATVVADACATRDLRAFDGTVVPAAAVHRTALAELADRFATVVPSADALAD